MNCNSHDGQHPHKPHGSFAPQPERGVYLLREPKGIPDVLLLSTPDDMDTLFTAANILSVQGITARIVIVEDIARFCLQNSKYRTDVFSEEPHVRIGLIDAESAMRLTNHAIHCMEKHISAAEIAKTAVSKLQEQK